MTASIQPLCFLAGTEALSCQLDGWKLDQDRGGDRSFSSRVRFERPFQRPPLVHVGLGGFDISNRDAARLKVAVENVTTEGFEIVLSTWLYTRLWRADVNWIAVGS